ncbi:MAG: hypothetical protein KDD59_04140 [Bdellovibrionales bacterium]|nr:hypothetical protein [Bdellovibrionales bacterium]
MNSQSGSVLAVVVSLIFVIILLSGGIGALVDQKIKETSRQTKLSQIEYFSEGVLEITLKLTQDYLALYPMKDGFATLENDINTYIATQMPVLNTSTQFQLDSIEIKVLEDPRLGTVPMGAFAGMNALLTDLNISINASDLNTSSVRKRMNADVVLASIKLFQFQLFMSEWFDQRRPWPISYQGRVHVNQDVCARAQPFRIDRLTSGGRVLKPDSPDCLTPAAAADTTEIAIDGTFTNFANVQSGGDHGCVNCLGTGLDWVNFAVDRWNGRLLDKAHGVEPLLLPIAESVAVRNSCNYEGTPVEYNTLEALIIEPPQTTDSPEVKDQRLSIQADLRIINGVWYIKDPLNPYNFPGLPIWSDHPGQFTTTDEEGFEGTIAVGQDDIRARWVGTATEWPTNSPPKLYSYYEYDTASQQIFANTQGTVSYGSLFRDSGPTWRPGHFVNASNSALCATSSCTTCSTDAIYDATLINGGAKATCGGSDVPISTGLLNATRSGFKDGVVYQEAQPLLSGSDSNKHSKRLPINFDLAYFQRLLDCDPTTADYHPGNVGCYFGTGKFMNRDFNGMIYITTTWPGSHGGLGQGSGVAPASDQAAFAPYQHIGTDDDVLQTSASHPGAQRSLPFNLCSDSLSGQKFDAIDVFKIPPCNRYSPNYVPPTAAPADRALVARTNTMRLINASNLDPNVFANGLTIATDLSIFTVGDYNSSSDVTSAGATPWVGSWVVGDRVIPLSNGWEDKNARWDEAPNALMNVASDMVINAALTPPLDYLYNFEDKRDTLTTMTGSQAKLYRSPRYCYPGGIVPNYDTVGYGGTNQYFYDEHFSMIGNQPPGTPTFYLNAVRKLEK